MSKKTETAAATTTATTTDAQQPLMTREGVRGYAQSMQKAGAAEETAVAPLPGDDDASAMFLAGDEAKAAFAKALDTATGIAPRFMQLQPGQTLQGDYVGKGTMELTDTNTGELKEVNCYWFQRGKLVVKILGAHELDQALATLPSDGTFNLTVYRGEDENIGKGRRVSRYGVAWKPSGRAPTVGALPSGGSS